MNYPLMAMVQLGVVPPVTFPTDSRYYGFGVQYYNAPNGQVIAYLSPFFVRRGGGFTLKPGDQIRLERNASFSCA